MRVDVMPRHRWSIAVTVCLALSMTPVATIDIMSIATPQEPVRAEQVDEWLASAELLLRQAAPDKAVPLFERALAGAAQLGQEESQAQALVGLSESRYWLSEYHAARDRGLQALALYERLALEQGTPVRAAISLGIGRSNHVLGLVADISGDAAEARRRAEQAMAALERAGDRRHRGIATLQFLRLSVVDAATEQVLTEGIIADARAAADPALEASALQSFGDHLYQRGQYAEALPKLEAAATLFEAAGRLVPLGTVHNSLGRLYRAHGRLDAALASQLKALAIHEKTNSPFYHQQSLNAVAVTYQSLGDSQQARRYFERALTLAERTAAPRVLDFLRANFAGTLLAEGDAGEAAEILEGVIARALDTYPSVRMRELAEAYLILGNHDKALTWAQKAVDACGDEDRLCVYALARRAEVHAAMGRNEAALADLNRALKTMETVRARLIPADFFKQQFHLAQEHLYSRAIALQFRGGRTSDALETAELARARAFVDLLASRDLTVAKDTGAALGTLSASPDGWPLVFRGASPAASGTASTSPSLASQSVVPPASAEQLVATARRLRSTLLAYWVTPDSVFIWVVSPHGAIDAAQVAVRPARLLALIRATNPVAGTDGSRTPAAPQARLTTRGAAAIAPQALGRGAWRELYDLLIKPVRHALPSAPGTLLTIVPHGPLAALAFAGLQDDRTRYLLESYTLHYAPAGAVLQFTATKRRMDARRGGVLIVADPVPPALSNLDRALPRLPGARTESRAIASLMSRTRITTLEGASAHERAVREASAGKRVLHFATHAVVRDDDPFSSFLAVARSGDEDDGLLTAQEIYGLGLEADLVVLSACRSAGGRVTGDGIATFARAFMYAGAPSIVASLWDVADEPTNQLLPEFYRAWLRGASKAHALRTAQLHLLKLLRAGTLQIDTPAGRVSLPDHPAFWAGFALIGEPD